MDREHLDKRFGVAAVEKGFIRIDQLMEAISLQIRENSEQGTHRLIGAILLDLGFMTAQQIDDVLEGIYGSAGPA